MPYRIKRIYDPPATEDGYRVLVDRLWPRGITKQRAALDGWLKDVAPSAGLRTWFHEQHDGFDEFAQRYRAELAANPAVGDLRAAAEAHPAVTLLYSVKDPERNHAAVLAEYLRRS